MADVSDDELVQRFLAGDANAFTDLARRHQQRIFSVCLRVLGDPDDAADATQDALLTVVRKLDQFRADAAFTTWLYRVTVNVCYDHLRRAKRRPMLHRVTDEGPELEQGPPVPDHADEVSGAQDISVALAAVPEDFRIALILADVQDVPYGEIARVLDVPVGTVKSRVHRGRIALAQALGREPTDAPTTSEEGRR